MGSRVILDRAKLDKGKPIIFLSDICTSPLPVFRAHVVQRGQGKTKTAIISGGKDKHLMQVIVIDHKN
jgi:hypothetical protein